MLMFAIGLDEEKIAEDKEINAEEAYKCIEDTFAKKEVFLYDTQNNIRFYTRNIDKHDFEYLWMVNLAFEEVDWFRKYVRVWKFLDIDEKNNKLIKEEDIIREWDIKD